MNIIGIIPARMKSSRLIGKSMKKIQNIPMIGHVYFRSKLSKVLNEVYVATCDKEIKNYVQSINGKVIMTSKKHKRAVDRTAEAMNKILKNNKKKIDLVVMIQGDEPCLEPKMINQVVKPFKKNNKIEISNLYTILKDHKEVTDPNRVKVVVDKESNAIYFSRESISTKNEKKKKIYYKQGNIFCFSKKSLNNFVKLYPSNLEITESIDMNRLIENRKKIKMVKTNFNTTNVDNLKDFKKVVKIMKKDKKFKVYSKKA
tara:strand:+ start:128 stop:901 length:774 start_codon:yes stop_codon:yes gene_type:complete